MAIEVDKAGDNYIWLNTLGTENYEAIDFDICLVKDINGEWGISTVRFDDVIDWTDFVFICRELYGLDYWLHSEITQDEIDEILSEGQYIVKDFLTGILFLITIYIKK